MIQADTKVNGIIPVLGFGTWKITGERCAESVKDAIDLGYRHIDTAQLYDNELFVGKGIAMSKTDRVNIFLTTKISSGNLEPSRIKKSTFESLKKLNTDYVDLLLIHWPFPGINIRACLETMFELLQSGHTRYVGVSNFTPGLFVQSFEAGPVINNQVKFSPLHTEFGNLKIAKEHKKIITAYSPLEQGRISKENVLTQIGEKYQKTAAQVTLRWLIQLGNMAVIPKAGDEKHRRENYDIFDFELTQEDIELINGLSNL